MTKYSCYEHSQSGDTSVETPDPDEIEADITTILTWYNDDFKNRPLMSNGVEVIDI
jgi:hypothetical protein